MLRIQLRILIVMGCMGSITLLASMVGSASCQRPNTLVAASPTRTPLQVALLLDSMEQPRFWQNAGQFGVDRLIVGGHDDVYELDARTGRERRALQRVEASCRPFVIAFLHCRHKPGASVGSRKPQEVDQDAQPYLSTLAAGTKTETGADKLREWADADLKKVVLPLARRLRQGSGGQANYGNWLVAMRPVRASRDSCLGCHPGARRGDTLCVMVYAVDHNRNSVPTSHITAGEE